MPLPPNPYVGPRAFQEGEILYGRDWETEELRDLLLTHRAVLLFAPSGAGKTSVVQARLIPALRREGLAVSPPMRVNAPLAPGSAPDTNRYLASVIAGLAPEQATAVHAESQLGEVLAEFFDSASGDGRGVLGKVLVIDQFEEIVTADPTDPEAKQVFFDALGALLRDPEWMALLAMREDHVGAIEPYCRRLPDQLSGRFRLDLLTERTAMLAIRRPALDAGVDFEEDAARLLLEDLRQVRVQLPDGKPEQQAGPYIEPIQLQLVCRRLWEAKSPDPHHITEDDVRRLGRIDDTLADWYATEVARIAQTLGVAERQLRRWIEGELIDPSGLRGQVLKGVRETEGLPNAAVSALIDAHLVRSERRRGADWLELAHDRLIEPVRNSNLAWRAAHLRPFQRLAIAWVAAGEPDTMLLNGAELADATSWSGDHSAEVTRDERRYLRASQDASRRSETGTDLEALGWGVIFPAAWGPDPPERTALGELLAHRRAEAGARNPARYREFVGNDGLRAGETARDFLARHGAGTLRAPPERMPGYLLIVGDPEAIPFEVQYGLDVQYAVGRIAFETREEYSCYARSVVLSERGTFSLPRQAGFFVTTHAGDQGTELVAARLVPQTLAGLHQLRPDWSSDAVLGKGATRERLGTLLGGPQTPALLFVAAHGLQRPKDSPRFAEELGGLVCSDWPGGVQTKLDAHRHVMLAEHVTDSARLLGSIFFFFGEFLAGTPEFDDFPLETGTARTQIAPHALLARLPQKLLGHPRGGGLAVIGHVDRNWAYTIMEEGDFSDAQIYQLTLARLMGGHTVGTAMELFNQRYATLSAQLGEALREIHFFHQKPRGPLRNLTNMMFAAIDARNYIVIGDPAVRLPVAAGPVALERPTIAPVETTESAAAVGKAAAGFGSAAGFERLAPESEAALPRFAPGPEPHAGEAPTMVVASGVNGANGAYLWPPLTPAQMAAAIMGTFPTRN